MRRYDWAAMQGLVDRGHGFAECHRVFGIAHATWAKALGRGDVVIDRTGKPYADARKRYDWTQIQAFHDAGNSVRACRDRFGFSMNSWQKARKSGRIRARGVKRFSIDELAVKRSNRGIIKRRLVATGHLTNSCTICGIQDWQGRPLTLQIDHINGKRLDYRLENLRMLCPNCHSQTDTFAGRNVVVSRRNPG